MFLRRDSHRVGALEFGVNNSSRKNGFGIHKQNEQTLMQLFALTQAARKLPPPSASCIIIG